MKTGKWSERGGNKNTPDDQMLSFISSLPISDALNILFVSIYAPSSPILACHGMITRKKQMNQ
jgi:hypothetical protein